ncbi:23S rRNA m(2)A-2503 methyltransferase [Halanaerobium congolense]|jgi:23S rRNA (adenine2503-C2)-methyltransferase|uniref:Probable dual-specificity RNA methyltransferase RlmN n=1 Tax=Halanaerobium congolense TaxID=54121 RepID=A0A1G8HNE8_9FIRM|nr:23S rRNA (adenine(2503)-C(2))-methyltransferase RlmN [Halanaerobium congolense]OEG63141.1 MAG: 23S rRNA (adenine(2503)-C(2))-methyltransferase [Halanaerobium sp. MDAL1]PUU90504.1 MAG: 23S rRNA (adenine2503-C2)-methyltransferase [Halanaerobium sp.]SDI08203.1 23S rRNA m(2)A-2503 methyltransferase [Halanaerobium congolense]SES95065.1 23S rRNA m(2)A-2503 methyltransferase [Halanaerobium congolense]
MKDLKELNRSELIDEFEKAGFPSYRGEQVFNWLYKNGVSAVEEMKNIPKKMRQFIDENYELSDLKEINRSTAVDGTVKYLWELNDGENIEGVYLPFPKSGRHSTCISTQVGCGLGCSFCATGIDGLQRNLTTGEIVDQVIKVQKDISGSNFAEPRLSNVVFMGMGEPLANFDNLMKAVEIINADQGLNIGMRKMTISTAGLVPEIKKLARTNDQIGLAVSLHAPNDRLRNKIMPINKKYNLNQLLAAVIKYIEKTGRRVTFEYVLMDSVNDSPELSVQLAELLRGINCHVNLIPANPVPELGIERPVQKVIDSFYETLDRNGIQVTLRKEMGTQIDAACGQLKRNKN